MEGPLTGMGRRFLLGVVFVTVGFWKPTFPADTASPARVPIQTELVGKLDAAHAKTGDAVYAKVRVKWQDNIVTLQAGVILRGSIVTVQARSKTNRNSSLALRFDSVEFRKNDTRPMALTLAAVMASNDSSADASEYHPLTSAVGLTLGSGSTGAGGPGAATSASGTRSLSAAATTVYLQARRDRQPKTIQSSQVVGVRGVKISVGGGPAGETDSPSAWSRREKP